MADDPDVMDVVDMYIAAANAASAIQADEEPSPEMLRVAAEIIETAEKAPRLVRRDEPVS